MLDNISNELFELFARSNKNSKVTKAQFIIDLREALARKITTNIWGNGFTFSADDEVTQKAFNKFSRLNRLNNFFYYLESRLSKYGRCVVVINQTEGGDYYLNIPDIFWASGVGKVFVEEQSAVVYQRYILDNRFIFVKSVYDTAKCVNYLYGQNGDKIFIYDQTSDIYDKLKLKPVWNHNLGFVPVVEFTNLAYKPLSMIDVAHYDEITDWYVAKSFEPVAYDILANLDWEIQVGHSRIGIENADQKLMDEFKRDGDNCAYDLAQNRFIIDSYVGAKITPIQGVGDFMKYANTLNAVFDFYFKLATSQRFSEGGGAQKTAAETASVRSGMIEYITAKILLREEQISVLLNKLFACMGHCNYWEDDYKFTFKINKNINQDDMSFIDGQLKLLSANAISIVDFIAKLNSCDKTQAEKIYERIKQENKEYQEQMLEQLDLSSGDPESHEKTMSGDGTHKKADMKGEA